MSLAHPTIAIIGCGWLGKNLIPILAPHYTLLATTAHTATAQALPVPAYAFNWADERAPPLICRANHIIIAIPPSTGMREDYPKHMDSLAATLAPSDHLIMISSTSIYPQQPGKYDENSATDDSSIVYQAEQNLRAKHPQAIILRCAGLIGGDRIPGKRWFGQRCDLANQRLNLIHHCDIGQAIRLILAQPRQQLTYNLSHSDHIWRHEYYQKQAERQGNLPPQFSNNKTNPDRIIDGTKITKELAFDYQYAPLNDDY